MNWLKRKNKNGDKIIFYYNFGRGKGQRPTTGIFTYTNPKTAAQKNHNKQALDLLEVKKSELTIETQSTGSAFIPEHLFKKNFLDYFQQHVDNHAKDGNKHFYYALYHFKAFLKKSFIAPREITEDLCIRFRKYLLDRLNGECPANYFRPFKRVLRAATKEGYFRVSPVQDVMSKEKKNKRRKNVLEVEDYIALLATPYRNEEIREAFIFCCYQGLRHCDVYCLEWTDIHIEEGSGYIVQRKTDVEVFLTLHPIAAAILKKRAARPRQGYNGHKVFHLPVLRACNYALEVWCRDAGVDKHITWHCARLSFSVLLQDENVDTVTVALLMGLTTVKHILANYRRHRPKRADEDIAKLPAAPVTYGLE